MSSVKMFVVTLFTLWFYNGLRDKRKRFNENCEVYAKREEEYWGIAKECRAKGDFVGEKTNVEMAKHYCRAQTIRGIEFWIA